MDAATWWHLSTSTSARRTCGRFVDSALSNRGDFNFLASLLHIAVAECAPDVSRTRARAESKCTLVFYKKNMAVNLCQ